MSPRLRTRPIDGPEDVVSFFDELALTYSEAHGNADRLLHQRVALISGAIRLKPSDRLLEVGCGPAEHLIALRGQCAEGTGLDLSSRMIRRAEANARAAGRDIRFVVGDARRMAHIDDDSIDAAFLVGTLEHVPEHRLVFEQVMRVLAPGGRLAVLTVNGDYVWYRRIAPVLGLETRHLSTDRFAGIGMLQSTLLSAGFSSVQASTWRFIPRGDMPVFVWPGLEVLDRLGRHFGISTWRGGLLFRAEKPPGSGQPV